MSIYEKNIDFGKMYILLEVSKNFAKKKSIFFLLSRITIIINYFSNRLIIYRYIHLFYYIFKIGYIIFTN